MLESWNTGKHQTVLSWETDYLTVNNRYVHLISSQKKAVK